MLISVHKVEKKQNVVQLYLVSYHFFTAVCLWSDTGDNPWSLPTLIK